MAEDNAADPSADVAAPSPPGVPLTSWFLCLSVFVSGGGILAVEIAASRILAPHFGNTLFTWTSIIGVILAALSVGYALGGRLADQRPSAGLYLQILLVGGALVALIPLLRSGLLPTLEAALGMRSGPVVSGILLFAAPSVVLAMLTPFAVKLSARIAGQEGLLGRLTGRLFAWSTVGSIAGTFLTGFVLVPWFGLNAIFLMTGGALALIAGFGFLVMRRRAHGTGRNGGSTSLTVAMLVFGVCFLSGLGGTAWRPASGLDGKTLWYHENMYHAVRIIETTQDEGQLRELYLDFQTEGAMVVGDPQGLYYDYTRFLQLCPRLAPQLDSALFLGGGAFSMPKALRSLQPKADITVVEVDPDVVLAARKFFYVNDAQRLDVHVGDARRYLRSASRRWDLIVADVFRGRRSIPPHLATREFFGEARAHLSEGGVLLLNTIGHRSGRRSRFYAAMCTTLRSVFPDVLAFCTEPDEPERLQNIVFFAFRDTDTERATRLAADPELAAAMTYRVPPETLPYDGQILTDDYNPVEYLVEQSF